MLAEPARTQATSQRARRRESVALAIGLKSGALRICLRHAHIYCDVEGDLSGAFSMALDELSERAAIAALFDGDKHALLDLLSAKLGSADSACPECELAGKTA